MKKYLLAAFLLIHSLGIGSQKSFENRALHLDGIDNKVCIGMDTLAPAWTLEAWIKGDDNRWNDLEVIIGGGEYSALNIADNLPLVVKEGRLHSTEANLYSKSKLDDQWHHVALTCDGRCTILYLDGVEQSRVEKAVSVLPGTIGVGDCKDTFGGYIDEVRIWKSVLAPHVLQSWMGTPVTPKHPAFAFLKGYYPLDDLDNEISLNWVGRGHQPYHGRNERNKFREKAPLAYSDIVSNPHFTMPNQRQSLFNAVVIHSEWDADCGDRDTQVLKLRIAVQGAEKPLPVSELVLDLSQNSRLADIEKVHIYYTGQTPRSGIRTELFGTGALPDKKIIFKARKKEDVQLLASGINYFLVTFDLDKKAQFGDTLHAAVTSFKLDKKRYKPLSDTCFEPKRVTDNSLNNPNLLKVLQWNIWHGGVHLGNEGRYRVLDLIQATRADIVTLQEGYGSQKEFADSLGYYLQTKSGGDNLALLSRYPIEPLSSSELFKSNPAKVILPGGKPILVNDCWLRYAYRPEYTCIYPNRGLDPNLWVAEDSILALVDMQNLTTKDIDPHITDSAMPVIIAGDFNSCSHLDWTEAARSLHFGYGNINFPTTRYLQELGYKDSFRELNPNEVTHQGGTFAVIYGHLQVSRIDFLYYKGGITPVASKIIRTAPEIDYVWPSDHAAVFTIFDTSKLK